MSEFRKNIARMRKKMGVSQSELAEKLGVRKTTISNYETGYSVPDHKMLIKLSDIFGVSVDSLLGHRGEAPDAAEPPAAYQIVPVVGEVRAGQPTFAIEEILGQLFLPRDMVHGYDYFGLVVRGDSMNLARIQPNDILLVRRQSTADNGDIVIASFGNEEATVKRYFRNGNQVILKPESTNPVYQPIQINLAEENDFAVLGKVIRGIINL